MVQTAIDDEEVFALLAEMPEHMLKARVEYACLRRVEEGRHEVLLHGGRRTHPLAVAIR